MSTGNVRLADMERITTPALSQKFIEEQIKEFVLRLVTRRCCWLAWN